MVIDVKNLLTTYDMLSAVKKCPNLFMLWGFAIPSNQAVASISMG